MLPETILQFGAGNFLRGFADLFVHHANERGNAVGRIVVVQSTGDGRANLLNESNGKYHVVVRGLQDGQTVDRVEPCASISRAIFAQTDWPAVLKVSASSDLRYILSNTTEAGYTIDDAEPADVVPPASFPGKLTAVLHARWQAGQPVLTVMPCELIEDNAEKLRGLVLQLSERQGHPEAFRDWVRSCHWLSSLVDRIVPGKPAEHPLLESDPLLIMAEPFAFWALQEKPGAGPWFQHEAITRAADVKPYFLRKVRILNGAHTALLCHVGLTRFTTVLEAMHDTGVVLWLEKLLNEEIVPTVADRVDDAAGFAKQTLERFRNPFLKHKLSDIALHHATKKGVRLEPTIREFEQIFGTAPPLLSAAVREDRVASGAT